MIFEVGPCRRRFATAIGVLLMTIKVNSVSRRCAEAHALRRRVTQAAIDRHAF